MGELGETLGSVAGSFKHRDNLNTSVPVDTSRNGADTTLLIIKRDL
jgi:hypothetical protein